MILSSKALRALGLLVILVPLGVSAALRPRAVSAADHADGPAAQLDPTADISDLFAWMSADTRHLNLVAMVFYTAGADAAFTPAVQYAFHIESGAAYGALGNERSVQCQFYDVDRIECWGAGQYVAGDPSDPAGIVSAEGGLRVFAGQRDDPFFFEQGGFNEVVDLVSAVAGDLTFVDGCPQLDAETQGALLAQLQQGPLGGPPADTFDGMNALALVVQLDVEALALDGPVVAVWASTHANPTVAEVP